MKISDGFLTIKDFHYSKFFACGFKVDIQFVTSGKDCPKILGQSFSIYLFCLISVLFSDCYNRDNTQLLHFRGQQ
jgi:hypothetical protein